METIVTKVDKHFNDMSSYVCICGKEKNISVRINIDNIKCECGKVGYWYTTNKWKTHK